MGRAQPYQASTTLPTTTTPTMAYFSKAAALLALCMTAMVSADPLTESFLDVDLDVVAPAAGNPSNDWQWESLPTKGRVYNRDGKGRCEGGSANRCKGWCGNPKLWCGLAAGQSGPKCNWKSCCGCSQCFTSTCTSLNGGNGLRDPYCMRGVRSNAKAKDDVCCPKACEADGGCGGPGCKSRGTGQGECCTQFIGPGRTFSKSCNVAGAPCYMGDGKNLGGEMSSTE